ncbi:hypothetical protein [Shouchella shacheensis]|uniref:hypothetical protein n=1 Tax=Shouchella shacheensis TaxID=1649580 RepID=UPI00073FD027|nr:hypothetical protein [Shouchella shacheensis]
MTFESLFIGFAFVFIQLYASRIISSSNLSTPKWLSLSGGVAIAYVFVYILPTLHEEQSDLGGSLALDSELYFLGLIGLLVYFTIYKLAASKREEAKQTRFYFVQVGFFALYTFMVSYIVFSSDVQVVQAVFYGMAVGLHFIGISHNLWLENKHLYLRYGRFMLAGATLLGAGIGAVGPPSGLYVDAMIAYTSGAMIFNVISKEIPAERNAHLPTFLVSAMTYATLIIGLKALFDW